MEYIITGIGTFFAFITTNQWIIPLINEWIEKYKNKKKDEEVIRNLEKEKSI